MTVGDPKKAMVLSVVAVMIVGVAVFRAIPTAPEKSGATLLPRSGNEKPTAEKPEEFPTPTIDPFSHPNLSKTSTEPESDQPPTERQSTPRTERKADKFPDGINFKGQTLPPPGGTNPANVPGISQQNEGEQSPLKVRLDAVVRGDVAMVILSVAGKSASPCREGSLVNEHIKVIQIKESSVVIESIGRRFEIAVGEEVAL